MEIYTIGFTKRSAADFFGTLEAAKVQRVVDVRLNNRSQLAGFTKASDLPFFLERIQGASYDHEPLLAPETEVLRSYRAREMAWDEYEQRYVALLQSRQVETHLSRHAFATRSVLLCTEPEPEHCHRRLAAEYLRSRWGDVEVVHL